MIVLLLSMAIAAFTGPAWAVEQVFLNVDCEKNQTCELKKFTVKAEDYSLYVVDRMHYGSRMYARYETGGVSSLEKFGIVQFIRGCQFTSCRENDGRVAKHLDVARNFFDGSVKFRHPRWVVDSVDRDPLYNSTYPATGRPRHAMYRWNTVPDSMNKQTEKYFSEQAPTIPALYVVDHPGQAFYSADSRCAANISLQFKTCIYKTADVPMTLANPEDIGFSQPIHCFDWQSSFIYDHDRGKYESPADLDPVCKD